MPRCETWWLLERLVAAREAAGWTFVYLYAGLDAVGRTLRRTLADHLGDRARRLAPWTVSAALATLQLNAEPALSLRPGTAVPDARSPAKHDGPRWAALGYAGRDDCFVHPETGSVRQ